VPIEMVQFLLKLLLKQTTYKGFLNPGHMLINVVIV